MAHLRLNWPLLPFLCGPSTSCSAVDPGEHSPEHFWDEASETSNGVRSFYLIPCHCSPNLCLALAMDRLRVTESKFNGVLGSEKKKQNKASRNESQTKNSTEVTRDQGIALKFYSVPQSEA